MFVLDISNANGVSMTELQDSWKIETPNTAGVNTEKRRGSQCGTVGTKLVMSGGVGNADSDPAMVDQTIAYDVEDNTWKKYPNYVEGTFGNRQM
jgi:N-acetylneuraminic acid mutarotase